MVNCSDIVTLKNHPGEFLVVSCEDFSHYSNRIWLCPIVEGVDDYPLHLTVQDKGEKSILCERLLDCDTQVIDKVVGGISIDQWNEVEKMLKAILGGLEDG